MKIYPAIDLHLGNAVRLYKGDYNQVTTYGSPKEIAEQFKKEGATFLHLVDLDGAKDGKFENLEAVKAILSTGIDAELGGGIRTIEHIKVLLDLGLKRVILGSSALNLDFVKEAIDKFGSDKIVVGIDCMNLIVKTHGWLNDTKLYAIDFANSLKKIGVKTIIFTDISKDGTLEGINQEQTKKMIDETGLNIVASGGAKSINDVKACKKIGCEGIILGKSLYAGEINLKEALSYED